MAKKRGNGEGTIFQRNDKRWEARVTVEDPLTGKQKRKYFTGKSQAEVRSKKEKFMAEVYNGTHIDKSQVTFGDWVNKWLELYVKPNVKISTYSKYVTNTRVHIIPNLGEIKLQKLDTDHIQQFYNKMKKSHSSSVLSIVHQIINRSLKLAVKRKLILENPAEHTTRAPVKYKEFTPLTQEEITKYLEEAYKDRLYRAFLLCFYSGVRRGELLALRWRDIDLENGILTVRESLNRVEVEKGKTQLMFSEPKTEKGYREIPLLPFVIKELKTHRKQRTEEKMGEGKGKLNGDDLVFTNEKGNPVDPRNLLRKHYRIRKNAGLRKDIRIHDIRHTFGTLLAQAGENPRNLQEILGHADIKTTLGIYCHSNLEDKKKTMETLGKLIEVNK